MKVTSGYVTLRFTRAITLESFGDGNDAYDFDKGEEWDVEIETVGEKNIQVLVDIDRREYMDIPADAVEMVGPQEGKCPACGADLDYDAGEVQDKSFVYSVSCPGCGWAGKECYSLVFSQQTPRSE